MSAIDIDFAEYCHDCRQPLILIETAFDNGQDWKSTAVTDRLAALAGIESAVLLYRIDPSSIVPGSIPNGKVIHDISGFRLKRNYPHRDRDWFERSPQEIANWLLQIRENHRHKGCSKSRKSRVIRLPLDDPQRAARLLRKHLTGEAWQALKDAMEATT